MRPDERRDVVVAVVLAVAVVVAVVAAQLFLT